MFEKDQQNISNLSQNLQNQLKLFKNFYPRKTTKLFQNCHIHNHFEYFKNYPQKLHNMSLKKTFYY